MHHKFLVFCEWREPDYSMASRILNPIAVWTGSFNATFNATRSLENAVVIRDPEIAKMYFQEWASVIGISESLQWNYEYVCPELRIGS